jgi:Scramblase
VEDPFDFQALRIKQPGKLLPDRAKYEIFNADQLLLATATETEGHARLKLIGKSVPDTRAFSITTAAGQPVGFLIKQNSEWITEFRGPANELIGRIRTGDTRRNYTLLGDQDEVVAQVTGDLALKRFSVADAKGAVFARVRKTFAGIRKEVLTSSDHYRVEFTGPVSHPARTLTVMMPIVLDLTLYEPV